MDKESYESLIAQHIQDAIANLLPHGNGANITESRLRAALGVLAERIASDTGSYELMNLKDSEELASIWGVSKRRVQTFVKEQNARWGVGRKVGRDWLLSADESERYRPAEPGRPRKKK